MAWFGLLWLGKGFMTRCVRARQGMVSSGEIW